MTIVILAEKREQGEKIADGLKFLTRGNQSFHGQVNGETALVCWAAGHLLTPQEPDKEKTDMNWYSPNSLLPAPQKGKMVATEYGAKILPGLKRNIEKASEVWIATDPDREGEAIGRNILQDANYRGPVKRMWLADSLEPRDIQRAAKKLINGDAHLPTWRAQQARQNADWMWQMLVRAYTMKGRAGLMGELLGKGRGRSSVVSVGRVQSAALKMVVDRCNEIDNFKPIDHFTISASAQNLNWPYQPPTGLEPVNGSRIMDDKGKIYFINKEEADAFVARLKGSVLSINKAAKRKQLRQPPTPYSLTSLQQLMARKYGMSSAKTLEIADKVRMDGYLTYPRTEHGNLPLSLYNKEDLTEQLKAAAAVEELTEAAREMYKSHPQETPPRCYTSKPMEHHGIIPTGKVPDLNAMSRDEANIFTECAKAFVTALHPPAEYDILDAEGYVETEGLGEENPVHFKRSFKSLSYAGWLALSGQTANKKDDDEVDAMPNINQGDELNIDNAAAKASRTKPPKHYNEATFLNAMLHAGRQVDGDNKEAAKVLREAKGIGTPATRASIIETLLAREYITRTRAKTPLIKATDKGKALIEHVPDKLVNVVITAQWESDLAQIEKAKNDTQAKQLRDAFMLSQNEMITRLIEQVVEDMAHVDTSPPPERSNEPTDKQINLVRKLGEQLGLDTTAAEKTRKAASAFIDKHIKKAKKQGKSTNPPTEKMLKFAESLAQQNNVKVPKAVQTSFDECKKFIDAQLKKKS